jgi:Matrixin
MRGSWRALSVLVFFLYIPGAEAYVRTMSPSGRPLYWPSPRVLLQVNPGNVDGISSAGLSSLFGIAANAWQLPDSTASIAYTINPGAPAASNPDSINSIYFSSQSGSPLDWGIVALTEVFYFVSSGQISESDTAFNDSQFIFTANPGSTGSSIGTRIAIYLPDVATHEAGHTLGLDHSTVNLSSMIYTAFSGQFSPSGDDTNAIRTIYPAGGSRSALTGYVEGTAGGIFGAQVSAINLATGKIEAATLANTDGSFRIGDIAPGSYAVMMEPFGVSTSTVSAYYANVDHHFCGINRFRRSFYAACNSGGAASVVEAVSGGSTSLGTLAPSCTQMGNPGGAPTSVAGAKSISPAGGTAFGTLLPGQTHYYKVHGVSGQLTARALSFSLFSPVDVQVQFLNADGSALAGASSVDNVGSPLPGGKINYDSSASANVPQGDYLIQVSAAASRVPASAYSAGYELLDADGHYLLALGVNGSFGPSSITDMQGCVSVPNSLQNASYDPSAGSGDNESVKTGCGSLNSSGGNPFSGGMMQVLLTALGVQILLRARRLRPALVRKRR